MPDSIVMPNLGFDSQESRLIEWLKQPGDAVKRGDPIALIESDKAEIVLESTADGVLLAQHFADDTLVPVGATIATVGQAGESAEASLAAAAAPSDAEQAAAQDALGASPIARRMADEHGIALAAVTGTGPRGRVTRQDVEAHLHRKSGGSVLALPKVRKAARDTGIDLRVIVPSDPRGIIGMADLSAYTQPAARAETAAAPPPVSVANGDRHNSPQSRMRRRIAERMAFSKREAPHFYVSGEFDLDPALQTLQRTDVKLNALIQYLTVRTLKRETNLNATYEDGELYHYDAINLAIAIALDEGLIAPVLQNAGRYSLEGLAEESRALIERARSNTLRPEELSGGTFTISNLGVIKQVDEFVAVINPPQVGILAVGTVKQRPVVIDGGLHMRHTVKLTLSGDHRAVDGMDLGRFLAAFQTELDIFVEAHFE